MEKILAFHIKELDMVKRIVSPLRIRVMEVQDEALRQPLGVLAGVLSGPKAAPFTKTAPKESLLLFCGVTEKHLDKVLNGLERHKIKIDYKAVLTETSKHWDALRLYLELEKEKRAIELQKSNTRPQAAGRQNGNVSEGRE